MKTHRYSGSRSGFTLVELLVVIAIITVLAALGFGAISKVITKQKMLATQSFVSDLSLAIDQYYNTYGKLPGVGSQDEMTAEGQAGAELLTILLQCL